MYAMVPPVSLPVQIRLYQLSRLLHDVLPTLHSHLGMHEITPFYYAAPWFLTLFSSQFPIAFVARVMGEFCVDTGLGEETNYPGYFDYSWSME